MKSPPRVLLPPLASLLAYEKIASPWLLEAS